MDSFLALVAIRRGLTYSSQIHPALYSYTFRCYLMLNANAYCKGRVGRGQVRKKERSPLTPSCSCSQPALSLSLVLGPWSLGFESAPGPSVRLWSVPEHQNARCSAGPAKHRMLARRLPPT